VRPIEPIYEPMAPLSVLYDAECPFCRWTVGNLRRWDRERNLRLRPFQTIGDEPVLADLLAGHSLGRSVHAVDRMGRVAAGGDAFLAIAALLPAGRSVVGLVAAVPISRAAVRVGYRVIGRVRGPLASLLSLDGPRLHDRNPAFRLPDE